MRVHIIKKQLVILELVIPFGAFGVAEIVSQRGQDHCGTEELWLLSVLVQEHLGPVLEISRIYCFWGDSPGTTVSASRKPFKIKLAAYFRIRPTSVGDVVAVEGHHMAKNVCDRSQIPILSPKKLQCFMQCKVFFNCIMNSLNKHVRKSSTF